MGDPHQQHQLQGLKQGMVKKHHHETTQGVQEQQHKLRICGSRLITTKNETISFQNKTIRTHEHTLKREGKRKGTRRGKRRGRRRGRDKGEGEGEGEEEKERRRRRGRRRRGRRRRGRRRRGRRRGEEGEEKKKRRSRGEAEEEKRRRIALIKSSNPHLAGGERAANMRFPHTQNSLSGKYELECQSGTRFFVVRSTVSPKATCKNPSRTKMGVTSKPPVDVETSKPSH